MNRGVAEDSGQGREDRQARAAAIAEGSVSELMMTPALARALDRASSAVARLDYCTHDLAPDNFLVRICALREALVLTSDGSTPATLAAFYERYATLSHPGRLHPELVKASAAADAAIDVAAQADRDGDLSASVLLSEHYAVTGQSRARGAELMDRAFDDLDALPPLVQAAIAHARVTTLARNRSDAHWLGEAILALYPCIAGRLRHPVLQPGLYLLEQRDRLDRVAAQAMATGDWDELILGHLDGLARVAEHTAETIRQLRWLLARNHEIVKDAHGRKKHLPAVLDELARLPFCTVAALQERASITYPTAKDTVKTLEELNILVRVGGGGDDNTWNALYKYARFLDIADRPFA